ncbi:MAG: nucleotidyltransferase domain-containing protein, partial [Candidatus Bathyarchaeota archaeon]|nr:nucleotidyltransferase domain-containing protein [Candidatus Bathyarchaeota archaeon]
MKSELERLIKAFLDEILARLEPCCVILFGSYARGSYTEYSDIDLCVISDRLPTDIVKRRTIATGIPRISAIGFTKDEVSRMIDDLNPLILD